MRGYRMDKDKLQQEKELVAKRIRNHGQSKIALPNGLQRRA